MVSKAFKLAGVAKNTTVGGLLVADAAGGVVTTYNTHDSLPLSGNSVGDVAFVDSSNYLYFYKSTGWFRIVIADSALS